MRRFTVGKKSYVCFDTRIVASHTATDTIRWQLSSNSIVGVWKAKERYDSSFIFKFISFVSKKTESLYSTAGIV